MRAQYRQAVRQQQWQKVVRRTKSRKRIRQQVVVVWYSKKRVVKKEGVCSVVEATQNEQAELSQREGGMVVYRWCGRCRCVCVTGTGSVVCEIMHKEMAKKIKPACRRQKNVKFSVCPTGI